MQARQLLDTTELFADLPPPLVDDLRAKGVSRAYARGDLVFEQGAAADELFLLVEGRVAIATHSSDGRESVVAVLDSGALFGELALFDDQPRSADARALATTEILAFHYDDVHAALESYPEAMWTVTRLLAQRLRATDEALADAVFLDVPARTAKRLLDLAGDQETFTVPLTQEEIAGLVGASRERVNKALATFVRLGWLETEGRGSYRILDREQLELRAKA